MPRLITCLLLAASNLLAGGLYAEPMPLAYINIPFGASKKVTPSYGLQLARVEPTWNGSANIFTSIPYAEMKFTGTQLDSFKLNGVNMLQKITRYNADGTTSTHSSINWKYVGIGALAFGGLWWVCEERDWDLCGGDHDNDSGGMTQIDPPEL